MPTFKLPNLRILSLLAVVILGLVMLACERVMEPSNAGDENNFGRITLTDVDNVVLGMSTNEAISLLGQPDRVGIGEGFTAVNILEYTDGLHAGVTASFVEPIGGAPTSNWPLTQILLAEKYVGKTSEGIGIRSSREDVHKIFGEPSFTSRTAEALGEGYAFDTSKLYFSYKKDRVIAIFLYLHERNDG